MERFSRVARPLMNQIRSRSTTPLRPLSSQSSNRGEGKSTTTKFILAAALTGGIAYSVHMRGQRHAENTNYRKPVPISTSNSEGNMRHKFNFIDKVVKQCASSVVYIEIKDPKKIDPETGKPVTASNGSGFVVRDDGWILTNAHVVINKPNSLIMVMLKDGSVFQATVVDVDMNIDLALLKVQCDHKLPYLRLGNSSDVNAGEWVVALGSPLSLSHSVTAGVISSVDRGAEELGLRNFSMRYIQTDAAITFGNSGGPLVNLEGEVIGINNLRVTAGIAFAIPVDYAKKFLERSRFSKRPVKVNMETKRNPFLGITTLSVTPQLITELLTRHQSVPRDLTHGVLVWKVVHGTIAQQSGLLAGDIITHVNGFPVHQIRDVYTFYKNNRDKIKINVIRKGVKKEIFVKTYS